MRAFKQHSYSVPCKVWFWRKVFVISLSSPGDSNLKQGWEPLLWIVDVNDGTKVKFPDFAMLKNINISYNSGSKGPYIFGLPSNLFYITKFSTKSLKTHICCLRLSIMVTVRRIIKLVLVFICKNPPKPMIPNPGYTSESPGRLLFCSVLIQTNSSLVNTQ